MSWLLKRLLKAPRTSLLLILVGTVVIGTGVFRLTIDFSPEQVYVGNGNAVEFCERHKQLFRFEDSLILVLLESTDQRSLLREDGLTWMKNFADAARRIDGVRDVTSLVTLQRPGLSPRGDDLIRWSPLLSDQLYGDHEYLQGRMEKLPLLNDTLISQDQQLTLTLIDIDPADRTIQRAAERIRAVERILNDVPCPEGTQTAVSGVPAIRVDVVRSILDDQFRMVPVCSALFLIVSLLIFRSLLVTALSLFAVLTALVATLGLMGWLGLTFSVMSNMVPTLLLIIGAANNVHILSRFQVETRLSRADAQTTALVTMQEMSGTCFLTLATTAVGFGSLMVAEADLLKSLAIQAALAMACCYVFLMLVMPPTLVICADRLARRKTQADDATAAAAQSVEDDRWSWLGNVLTRHAALITVAHLLLAAVTLWSCRHMRINSYMFETYDGDHPTMQVIQRMDERMSGLVSLEIQLQASDQQRFFDADVSAAMARIRQQLPDDGRITFHRDYIEFLAEFDRGRPLDEDPEVASESLQRVRRILRQLETPAATSAFLATDQPKARMMLRIRDIGSAGMRTLFDDVEVILQRELPNDLHFQLTGDAYLHAICMDVFVRDLFSSLIAASGVIFLLITILFRSLRIGLISAVPNLFPLVMTLGYMQLRGYELTAGNVIVFAISLGIAVDDTIHFLARYRDEVRLSDSTEAIRQTLVTSGRAIVLTSVLVVSGLSVLVFSDFVPTRRFAELTAVTMCSALPGDIILLPALLSLFGGRRLRSGQGLQNLGIAELDGTVNVDAAECST
ncbi:MAG: MMPL family transporter [Planctomycetaceae bacterium]